MKVAMLAPWPEPPGLRGPGGSVVPGLADGLADRGIDVTLFACGDLRTRAKLVNTCQGGRERMAKAGECLHISEVFERGEQFDLIHILGDYLPLTYMGMTTTPVICTLPGCASPQALPVYKKYNQRAYYVAVSEADKCPELDYIATIPYGIDVHCFPFRPEQGRDLKPKTGNGEGIEEHFNADRTVEDYLKVYEKVIKLAQREDHRPWGFYEILSDTPHHKVKRITVYPGQRLSHQRHFRRSEHWYVISGTAIVTKNHTDIELTSGQAIDLPVQTWHRVRNPGPEDMVFIEVQTGDYFGEDDIERSEDDYGRS